MKSFAFSLAFMTRLKVTQKWPIFEITALSLILIPEGDQSNGTLSS